jgi:predicted ATPase
MGRCSIQVVMGPAGSGKSTYCTAMQEHCAAKASAGGRGGHAPVLSVANLDPAAEHFDYNPVFDVRDLINVVRGVHVRVNVFFTLISCALFAAFYWHECYLPLLV